MLTGCRRPSAASYHAARQSGAWRCWVLPVAELWVIAACVGCAGVHTGLLLLLLLVQAGVVPGVKLVLEEPISITSFALSLLLVFRWGLQA